MNFSSPLFVVTYFDLTMKNCLTIVYYALALTILTPARTKRVWLGFVLDCLLTVLHFSNSKKTNVHNIFCSIKKLICGASRKIRTDKSIHNTATPTWHIANLCHFASDHILCLRTRNARLGLTVHPAWQKL